MEALILLAILTITQIVKNYIKPNFGTVGVHVFIFLLGMCGAGIELGIQHSATFKEVFQQGLGFLVLAVACYEIILKHLGINKLTKKK